MKCDVLNDYYLFTYRFDVIVLVSAQTNDSLPFFIAAIKTPSPSKGTGDLRVIVGVILPLLAIAAFGLIYQKFRNSKRNEPKRRYYS